MKKVFTLLAVLALMACSKSLVVNSPTGAVQGGSTVSTVQTPPTPRDTINLYIIAGQSNCGRSQWPGNGSTGPVANDSEKMAYGAPLDSFLIYNPGYHQKALDTLQAGVSTMLVNYTSKTEMGMEVSFSYALKQSGLKEACIVKMAYGNTDLKKWWNGLGSQRLYPCVDLAIRLLKKRGKVPFLKGFIWMQGEADAGDSASAANYESNLTLFFHNFDAFYAKELIVDTLPGSLAYKKVIGRINGVTDPLEIYRDKVRSAQENFCNDSTNHAVMIDTDNYPLFNIHYTLQGQIQFGLDIFNQLKHN